MRLLSGLRKTSSFFFLPLLLSLVAWKTTLALYEDHIGLVDWHKQNIGTPKVSGFYTVNNTRTFITATTKNVLSSVKSENGELVWRQVFQPDDTIHTMKVHNERESTGYSPPVEILDHLPSYPKEILTLSGQSTVAARLWDATSGHVVWETILSSETEQPLKSKKMVDAIFLEDGHIAASIHGKAVFKLQASTGAIVWNWESPADHVLFKISHDSQGVHLVGRNVGDREDKNLYVYRLSYAGEQVAAYKVECNAKHINNLILVGGAANPAYLIWKSSQGRFLWAHKLGFEGVTSEVSAEVTVLICRYSPYMLLIVML
ncbi:hypothetical protein K493DRAFT_309586 [Basidiobolus meristosporus CBS 931.73]|uniref:EMC1 first beta-propeller domain-containing protein n=1 Tax=Basidiobolus meristosporus CBS 931.73 TaxID=1314790 RepID=A0A1Y1VSU1_9FUNG|nr:hypothetical protein K493DRAFT_309586 [Basidiobolus meristosporus CBS 931.73]|eukprot:ORX64360.1 hypothetical protein K493DRAFT_309586 [Basidiobolus meristosporus CBS 931.73]